MDQRRKAEIQRIKELGESIGYGNLMDVASALWVLDLERNNNPKCGAFIPTVELFLTEEGKKKAKKSMNIRIGELEYLGF